MKKRPNSVPPINIMCDDLSQATHLVSAASLALGDIDHYARNAVSAVLEIVEEKLEDIERRLEILNRALAPDHSVASDVQRLKTKEDAEKIKATLEKVGAKAELKRTELL